MENRALLVEDRALLVENVSWCLTRIHLCVSEHLSLTEISCFLTYVYVCETECLLLMRRARETVRERISVVHRDIIVPDIYLCM